MYLNINFLKKIIPRSILLKYEDFFRFFYYQVYRGKNFECNICGKKLRKFLQAGEIEKLCPNCGALSRTRRLWNLLTSDFFSENIEILDFSPSRSIYKQFRKNTSYKNIIYTSSVYSDDFLGDVKYNITNINCEDNKFDLIICYHILEHIEDDNQAMRELYRVLKRGGTCIIQTPFAEGEIQEDLTIKSKAERLKYYGQEDHVRIYSVCELKNRLKKANFEVDIRQFTESDNNKFGFSTEEKILICKKN